MRLLVTAALACSFVLAPSTGASQEPTAPPADAGRRNHAELYLGFYEGDFTLGGEISRRQPDRGLALSGFFEAVFADDTHFLIGGTLQYHMRRRLYFEAGPGWAFNGGSEYFTRIGAGWEFGLPGLTITPRVTADFIGGGTNWGYGISIGRRF